MKLPRSTAFRRPLIAGLLGGLCFAMLATWPAAGIVLGPMCALALLLGVVQPIGYGRVVFTASAVLLCVAAWQLHSAPDQGPASLVADLILIVLLALPLLQAWAQRRNGSLAEQALSHAWHLLFTLLMTLLLLVACWLLLGLWAQMFSLLHIDWFERLFFNTSGFPPIACGLIAGSSVALCQNATQASGWLRNLLSQFARGLAPLQALALLAFTLATLGLGLRPLPDWAPGALPLSALALTMLLLDAMAHSREHPPLPRAVRALTETALALTSVLALLAGLAVTTRVGQYGWTPKRVLAAAAAAFALCWSLVWLAAHIRRWRGRPLAHAVPSVAALVLGLLLLIALQSPLLDPQRITVNSQMARLESGAARADDSVVQVFEEAGTLGQAALAELRTHPQWLENPDRQTLQLAHRQGMNSGASSARPAPELLKRYLRLRENSAPPPATWWQGIDDDTAYRVANCLAVEGQCTVWSMPMTDDGETAVLLFDPKANDLYLFAQEGGHWAIAGSIGPSAQGSSGTDHLLHGKLGTQPKRWHDLTVDGQRYRVDYFNDR